MLEVSDARTWTIASRYLDRLSQVLTLVSAEPLAQAIALLLKARAAGRRVYVAGSGGSAATASHFVCDLVKGARVAGIAPMRAFALAERNFAEQILALAEPEDIVVVISAGSNSPNILAALEAASSCGAWTIGLLGFDG